MNMETTIVARPERLTNLAELLRRFERDDMERAVDLLIAMMDAADVPADPDAPDFTPRSDGAPGTADDAEPDADREQAAFAEWKAEGRHKLYAGGVPTRSWGSVHEDDEDDDPREDDGEDCCVAWEDDASRFSEGHAMGFGRDRPIHDPDAEPEHDGDPLDDGELTTIERERQPDNSTGYDDDMEPCYGRPTLNLDAANAA